MFSRVVDQFGGFDILAKQTDIAELDGYCDRIYSGLCNLYASASYMTSVEWVMRQYLAAKKMALSALFMTQATQLRGAMMKNLQFYSCYYSLFNALSANLLIHVDVAFPRARSISHTQLHADVDNYFVRFGIYGSETLNLLSELRFTREMYSYDLPLSGTVVGDHGPLHTDVLHKRLGDVLPSVLQVSDLLSFLAYLAWEKKVGKAPDKYFAHQGEVDALFWAILRREDLRGNHAGYDDGDYERLGKALMKIGQPFPIRWFLSDKVVDDIEGNWEREEGTGGSGYDIDALGEYLTTAIGC